MILFARIALAGWLAVATAMEAVYVKSVKLNKTYLIHHKLIPSRIVVLMSYNCYTKS